MIQFVRISHVDAQKHQQLAGVYPNVCVSAFTHQLCFEGDPALPPEGFGQEHQRRWNQQTPVSKRRRQPHTRNFIRKTFILYKQNRLVGSPFCPAVNKIKSDKWVSPPWG